MKVGTHIRTLLPLLVMATVASSHRQALAPTSRCSEGLLHASHRRSEEVPLLSFLSFSLTPMMDIKKECSVQVTFRDRYGSPVYLLEVVQTLGVGCWVTLRHVQSYELITKVLWPAGVLQGFERTQMTVVLRGGVLRVTAVTQHDSLFHGTSTHHNSSHATRFGSGTSYYSGPYLLLTSLRRLHEAWQEPSTVQLLLPPTAGPLHYTINCNSDDLQWAWMQVLDVREDAVIQNLPWALAACLAAAVVLLLLQWRYGCCLFCLSKQRREINGEIDAAPPEDVRPVSPQDPRGHDTKENSLSSSAFTNYAYRFN